MIAQALAKVVDRVDLTEAEMMDVMEEITEGRAGQAQLGAFMVGLRMKGETVEEITGAARVMRAKSERIPVRGSKVAIDRDEINVDLETMVDTCGTGGDGTLTFNVSTTTAFVAAGAGLKVAKHGNRSVSSKCGSADVVETLGVPLDLTPEQVADCIATVGIGFLYAPLLHSAMRHVIGARKETGLRTIFNLLGPLTNPAGASVQVLGVYREDLTETIAGVLQRLGCKRAFVVYGHGSYDELSIVGPSVVTEIRNGLLTTYSITPEQLGLSRGRPGDILGGNAETNADIIRTVLNGEPGPKRDMVLMNAAAALVAAGKAETLADGVRSAAQAIDTGAALEKLDRLISHARSLRIQTEAAVG